MRVVIIDCDHGFFTPEEKVFKEYGIEYSIHQCRSSNEVIEVANDADAIICQKMEISKELLKNLPRCKVVGRCGAGVDNVDVVGANELGIKVTYVPDYCFLDVADFTMGLILSLSRQIVKINQTIKDDAEISRAEYNKRLKYLNNVNRANTMVLGIIGVGRVGSSVAKRARGFGYNAVGYDPYVPSNIMELHDVRKMETLEKLLEKADIVTIHAPLTDETYGMIGQNEIKKMKNSAYLINTTRGKIVDERALIQALEKRCIAGAALDVLEEEPIQPDHPFLKMDNVILTPHIAFYSNQSILDLKDRISRYVVNILRAEGDYEIYPPENSLL